MVVQLVSEDGEVVRVALEGPVTAQQIEHGETRPLEDVLGEQWSSRRIALDMTKAEYIDSTAIGWLLSSQKQMSRDGGALVLHSVSPQVQEIFDILRINRVFSIAANEDEAVQIARGEETPNE